MDVWFYPENKIKTRDRFENQTKNDAIRARGSCRAVAAANAKDSCRKTLCRSRTETTKKWLLIFLFRMERIRQVSFLRFDQKLETAFQVRFAASRRPELNLRGRFLVFSFIFEFN
ncbi:hypothetical protein [Methanimicrococcus hongohii]|uniref:hypothetical protein n=1 Tax=Methanimicrococcus hongohii TaxID=3028295 RepID=UPI0029300DDE|nr:hypothetical protein [Methanimicrococcus sp. Hf6]